MREIDFPYPKISKFRSTNNQEIDEKIANYHKSLDDHRNSVKDFIYTDIYIVYESGDDRHTLSRIQQILSSSLLRSLHLRNGLVDAINSKNTIALFAILKSFIEVPALLAQLYSVVESNSDGKELLELYSKIVFGNRGNGPLRAGEIEAVNSIIV